MQKTVVFRVFISLIIVFTLVTAPFSGMTTITSAQTPDPASVTIAGSLQSELGCAGDWDPACAVTHLTFDAADDVWQGTWTVPAGAWNTKPRSTIAGMKTTASAAC